MLRVQPRPSSEESQGVDTAAREDLAKLQRQLRRAEGSKKHYADLAQNVIRRQLEMIRALEADNVDMKKNLSLAVSRQNDQKDKMVTSTFQELLDKQALYKRQIAEEEELISTLSKRIREMEHHVNRQRRAMGGAQISQTYHIAIARQKKVMENRLDKALVRFSTALSSNTKIRDQIDHMLQEKSVFEKLRKKLQRTLVDCKREMGEVIEESTTAYHSRDDAQTKLMALKEKADKELAQYNTELKELVRVIDHDKRLKEFMAHKDHERTEAHLEMEEARKRKLAEKATERERTVSSYEEAFECIQQATGITDIDQLVSKFIEVEDQNFALFNYVNELTGDMEMVQEQIAMVKKDMATFEREGVVVEEERKALMLGLEEELREIQQHTRKDEAQFTMATKVLDQLKTGIDSLFSKIGCDGSSITELLGGHAGVTENTVLQFLGTVEQRTNELLQLQAFIHAKESDDPEAINKFLLTRNSLQGLAQPSLLLPSTTSEYSIDEEDEDGKPLTQEELRQRAVKGITKREAKKAAVTPLHTSPGGTTAPPGARGKATSDKMRLLSTR